MSGGSPASTPGEGSEASGEWGSFIEMATDFEALSLARIRRRLRDFLQVFSSHGRLFALEITVGVPLDQEIAQADERLREKLTNR